jgi:hypothetical protein
VKIDKASLHASERPSPHNGNPPQDAQANPQANHKGIWSVSNRRERRAHRILLPASSVALLTLLVLALGVGIVVGRLWPRSSGQPIAALSPLPPTEIPLASPPPPTATATSAEAGDTLETLYIDISPRDMEQLRAKRQEALELGILLAANGDYVPAAMRLGHEEIPVELRLKGDWINHIAHDKWSFRVRTVGENYVYGMQRFSLHDPSMRSYLNEWLFLENMRSEDVLAVGYRFVHLVLNGEYKGIYALEEGFSKELFESQQRREGLIIRYDEDLVWEYRAFYDDQLIPRGVNEFYIIDEFQSGQIESNPALAAQRDAAVGMLRALWTGERNAAEVFDLTRMGWFLALSDLWSAPHGLIWHNLRYYYNPITALLEPIAFDSDALAGELDMAGLPQEVFYNDPYLMAAYVQALERISQPGYVEALETELGAPYETLRAALEPEFGADLLEEPWDLLRGRQALIRQVLDPYQTVYAYVQRPLSESQLLVDVGNLLELPLEIVGLEVNGQLVPATPEWVRAESIDLLVPPPSTDPDALILRPLAATATSMPYVHLQIPKSEFPNLATEEIQIVTRLWGSAKEHKDPVLPGYTVPRANGPIPEMPTVSQVLALHPYLEHDLDNQMLFVDGGTWDIIGNLILPAGYGLRLAPGTTLRFGRDNFLLSSGPLDFQGTEEEPILLQPVTASASGSDADQWRGIVVLSASSPSIWNYVTVERTAAIDQDGWTLTGGTTFYESPIRLTHSRIVESRAEDGINVVRARFEFADCEFSSSISDAFDADFSQGTVSDCNFHDTGGDGIDISGSDVEVQRVRMLNIGDKGISVGEASRLKANDTHFENVGMGVVSKDLSHATLRNAVIINAHVAGLAAYEKKGAYGPASMVADHVSFSDIPPERQTLIQTGSWIVLDGKRLDGTDIDVDALYQQQP